MSLNPFRLSELADVEHLHPYFAGLLERLLIDPRLEGRIRITSGYRTRAQQQALYDAYEARNFAPPTVARPGTSNHERGLAADLDRGPKAPAWELVHDVAAEYGLRFPVRGEPWHVEPTGSPPPQPPLPQEDAMPTADEIARALLDEPIKTQKGIVDGAPVETTETLRTLIGWGFVELQRIARATINIDVEGPR